MKRNIFILLGSSILLSLLACNKFDSPDQPIEDGEKVESAIFEMDHHDVHFVNDIATLEFSTGKEQDLSEVTIFLFKELDGKWMTLSEAGQAESLRYFYSLANGTLGTDSLKLEITKYPMPESSPVDIGVSEIKTVIVLLAIIRKLDAEGVRIRDYDTLKKHVL